MGPRGLLQSSIQASCPFVGSIGGTSGIHMEMAMDFSGGRFSDLFTRPTYQDQTVKSYFNRFGEWRKGLYNPNGRGISDVAGEAKNFIIREHDTYLKISGIRPIPFAFLLTGRS